ncbi:MAG: hypothetical protein ACOX1F_05420 [Erysipelotrichaceae bacterium]|jgi:hypothetical protein
MKKLLVFMMTLLMVLTMTGCGDPKEPEKPKLTEEQAIEFVKGLPQSIPDLEKMAENMFNMNTLLDLVNVKAEDTILDKSAPLDEFNNGVGAVDVELLQARINEVYFKEYDIATLFKDFIEDGKLIAPVNILTDLPGDVEFVYGEEIFEIHEAGDNYIVVKRHIPITLVYSTDNVEYDKSLDAYYTVVLTDNGPRVYSFDRVAVGAREPKIELPEVVE